MMTDTTDLIKLLRAGEDCFDQLRRLLALISVREAAQKDAPHWLGYADASIDRYNASLSASVGVTDDGGEVVDDAIERVLVPIQPTHRMAMAALDAFKRSGTWDIVAAYCAMVAASPSFRARATGSYADAANDRIDAAVEDYRQGLEDAAAIAERIRVERHDLCVAEEDEVELEVLSGQAFMARVILHAIEALKDNPNG